MYKTLCELKPVVPTDIVKLIMEYTDFSSEFKRFAGDVAKELENSEFWQACTIDMLKYGHYMNVPFYSKPDLTIRHLKVVQHVRQMFRGDVFHCRYDAETCGECAFCFSDKHQRLGWNVFMEGTYARSLKLDYDCVPCCPCPVFFKQNRG